VARSIAVQIDDEIERLLEAIAVQRGTTIERVVSQAIVNELFFAEQRARGARVLLRDADGSLREVFAETPPASTERKGRIGAIKR
jgi:hypothetical protein